MWVGPHDERRGGDVTADFESALQGVDAARGEFLRGLVRGAEYAEPAVSSFTMGGIVTAYADVIFLSSNTTHDL
jgi:hypothetical protein